MKGLCMIDWQIITKKCQCHRKVYRQIENSQTLLILQIRYYKCHQKVYF